jgi:predicted Zn-dependent protease with MMP-like domain
MDEVLEDEIRTEIFLQRGVKINSDDPIFLYFVGHKVVLDKFTQPIVDAMRALPGELEKSISKIVFAVEEAERTSETLLLETKGALSALAKCEVEAAQERLKHNIEDNVAGLLKNALQGVNDEVAQIERQVKTLGKGLRDSKASLLNMILAVAVVGLMGLFSVGMYMLYVSGTENRDAANYWHDQYKGQQDALKTLPSSLKKQLPNKLLIE